MNCHSNKCAHCDRTGRPELPSDQAMDWSEQSTVWLSRKVTTGLLLLVLAFALIATKSIARKLGIESLSIPNLVHWFQSNNDFGALEKAMTAEKAIPFPNFNFSEEK